MNNDGLKVTGPISAHRRLRRRLVVPLAAAGLAALAGCGPVTLAGGSPVEQSAVATPNTATAGPSSPTVSATPSQTATATPSATSTPSPSPSATDMGPTANSAPTSGGSNPSTTACAQTSLKGQCGPYLYSAMSGSNGQNTWVGQNIWNPISGASQSLYANNPGDWHAVANMPAGNTAVVSFPNGSEQYNDPLLSSFSSIYSSFTEDMNPQSGTSAEAAYDIWLNDWANEVMIQHDIVNRGTCPIIATAQFGGSGGVPMQNWNLCKYDSELIWQLAGSGEQSATVDVLAMLTWLETHGYLPHSSNLTALSYGFEICSTGGKPETFSVSRFTINATS
jgi:hypothetical protein